MAYRLVQVLDVPDADERWSAVTQGVWPEYNVHGDVSSVLWPRLCADVPELQFALVEEDTGDLAGRGYTIPFVWDGDAATLPSFDGVIEAGLALRERGGEANTLSALAIAIRPEHQGQGLAARMIRYMQALAREHRLGALVAPLRPTWKERYPLAPIERYAFWTRSDGAPFDPWIRLHVRLGGEILRPEPRSLRITGTVAEWEAWLDLPLPESGLYVFPQGLAPLEVVLEEDVGRYWEPNVWVKHAVA